MTPIDRLLQSWRLSRVRPFLRRGARVLDIGCADGVLFRRYASLGIHGVGLDPGLDRLVEDSDRAFRLLPVDACAEVPDLGQFDLVVMLAVLEHVRPDAQRVLAKRILEWLTENGRLVVTVPSVAVDRILSVLLRLRLVNGMSLDEHYGFRPESVPPLFCEAGFRLVRHRRFQLGLNNLFVFSKEAL